MQAVPPLEFFGVIKKRRGGWGGGRGAVPFSFFCGYNLYAATGKARAWTPVNFHSFREPLTFGGGETSQTADEGDRPMAVNAEKWPVDRMRYTCPYLDRSSCMWNRAGFSVETGRLLRLLGISPNQCGPLFAKCT